MKKFFLSALLAVAVATSAFSANDTSDLNVDAAKDVKKISVRTLRNFTAEFNDANDVSWSLKSNFAKVTFSMNNERMEAFYDLNGEMLGTSKSVSIDQMPVNVKRVFAKKYSDYTVKETIKFDGIDETAYYISADNDAKSIILKVGTDGSVSLFKSSKKN